MAHVEMKKPSGSSEGDILPEEIFVKEEEEVREFEEIAKKDRKLVTHPYDFIIRSLTDQIQDGTLVLADKFQRRRVWDDLRASRLIESLLLNVPIPVCYFAETEEGAYSVIDGQQRLTAIFRFLSNEFPLRGLKVRPELNKLRFHQLDIADKRLINSRTIRCIVILKESHPSIRFDVFEKLNTSSVRLNNQELRNSMFRGPFNDLIRDLSENELFFKVRNVQAIDKRMQDCELILRFFSFYYRLGEYRGALGSFFDTYLDAGNRFSGEILESHRKLFVEVINSVQQVFGQRAFRRATGDSFESLVNRALYDVIMLSFANIDPMLIKQKKSQILTLRFNS